MGFLDKNNFNGTIDGEVIPRLHRKNFFGNFSGVNTTGAFNWGFGGGDIEFTEGEYKNQVAYDALLGQFYKWNGDRWEATKGDEALKLFRNRNEYQQNAVDGINQENLAFKSYSTAVDLLNRNSSLPLTSNDPMSKTFLFSKYSGCKPFTFPQKTHCSLCAIFISYKR